MSKQTVDPKVGLYFGPIAVHSDKFESVHGHKPRGRADWAFYIAEDVDPWYAPPSISWTEAKRAAVAEARARGCRFVSVCPIYTRSRPRRQDGPLPRQGSPSMKVHMVKVSQGIFGGGLKRGSLCGRLNNASRDGMNITLEPHEVTCGFCRRFSLKEAATRARKTEREFNRAPVSKAESLPARNARRRIRAAR